MALSRTIKYGATLLGGFLLTLGVYAQKPEDASIIPGDVLVAMRKDHAVEALVREFSTWNGKTTALRMKRQLSSHLRIWQLKFNDNAIHQYRFLEALKAHPSVHIAQFNHRLDWRKTPNDPLYTSPDNWPYDNDGSGTGVPDADIDAPEAWDITTGGSTVNGDTIVVAVVDGGFDLAHEDLDFFYNKAELNGTNGVDDDNNGYVDDINGWDAYDDDGTISSDNHGTHVAGIVGGIGNNGKGHVGVNWHVKVLPVMGGGSEAVAVAAYDYVLTMRRRYNETSGAEGAFVVATNSSFGVDGGDPADYPLWCNMYDSLGAEGVLSAVAGPNTNTDIDQAGDIPGTCPSNYTLSITSTKKDDNKASAGYGEVNVDLGAPGQDILSTSPGDQYNLMSGTSMASPHVAGAVGLLYSVRCPNLMALAASYPDSLAREMKRFLMKGVDTLSSLQGKTVSGGRLNLHKAMLEMDSAGYCDTLTGCYVPYALSARSPSDTTAILHWSAPDPVTRMDVRFRLKGSGSWDTLSTTDPDSIVLEGLAGCSEYEYQVQAHCTGNDSSAFSGINTFKTLGCCESPEAMTPSQVTDTTAAIDWPVVFAAQSYSLRYRLEGVDEWTDSTGLDTNYLSLKELTPCMNYEVQLRNHCDTGDAPFSDTFRFRTDGCDQCSAANYCVSDGNSTDDEWIGEVRIGSAFSHISGDNLGYADNTSLGVTLYQDLDHSITLIPEYSGQTWDDYFRVWIDFDRDGTFNMTDELVYQAGPVSAATSGSFHVPSSAVKGGTMMRVSMKYDDWPTPCENFDYGEVEDYCVSILDESIVTVPGQRSSGNPTWAVYPNPARDRLYFQGTSKGTFRLQLFGPLGKKVHKGRVTHGRATVDVSELSTGIYYYRLLPTDDRKAAPAQGKVVIDR